MSSMLHGDRCGHAMGHVEALPRVLLLPHRLQWWTQAPEDHVEQNPGCGVCSKPQWAALRGEEESGRESWLTLVTAAEGSKTLVQKHLSCPQSFLPGSECFPRCLEVLSLGAISWGPGNLVSETSKLLIPTLWT